jgi:hemerythrin
MKWDPKYALGLPAVDAQHRQLFLMSDELEQALEKGISKEHLDTLLSRLGTYTIRHFILEEKYMQEAAYPGLAEQQKAHKAFIAQFEEFQDLIRKDGFSNELVGVIHKGISTWIQNHVTGLDKQFGDFLQNHS